MQRARAEEESARQRAAEEQRAEQRRQEQTRQLELARKQEYEEQQLILRKQEEERRRAEALRMQQEEAAEAARQVRVAQEREVARQAQAAEEREARMRQEAMLRQAEEQHRDEVLRQRREEDLSRRAEAQRLLLEADQRREESIRERASEPMMRNRPRCRHQRSHLRPIFCAPLRTLATGPRRPSIQNRAPTSLASTVRVAPPGNKHGRNPQEWPPPAWSDGASPLITSPLRKPYSSPISGSRTIRALSSGQSAGERSHETERNASSIATKARRSPSRRRLG